MDKTISYTLHFSRRPLTIFSQLVTTVLLLLTIFLTLLAVFVAKSTILLIVSISMFLIAGLVASGIRWAPLLGSLICSFCMYAFVAQSAFPLYHLAHPKDAYNPWQLSYIIFIVIVILFWGMLLTFASGIVATILNYRQQVPHTPRWFSHALSLAIGLLLGAILIGSFGPTLSTASAATSSNGVPTVHMGITSFLQSSVTVPKGSKLTLVDDGNFEHILSNGEWVNGQPQTEQQAGAPKVNQQTINGQSLEIGPFTTAGTYHLYCSIHTGMTLTIIVQ